MATRVTDPKVGMLVYEPFEASNPGIIRTVASNGQVFVDWFQDKKRLKGTANPRRSWEHAKTLKDYDFLIDEQDRKLTKHQLRAARLRIRAAREVAF